MYFLQVEKAQDAGMTSPFRRTHPKGETSGTKGQGLWMRSDAVTTSFNVNGGGVS